MSGESGDRKPFVDRGATTVLVAGAAGYIGGRLVKELLASGYNVRCMVIDSPEGYRERWPGAEVAQADARDEEAVRRALSGVDAAYYLIHSLLPVTDAAVEDNVAEAASFRRAAEACSVKRIIYLGSLVDIRAPAGSLEAERARVVEELRAGAVPVTELRADIIIGSGSASFEIIRNLVRRLPVMLLPDWTRRRHLPVSTGYVVGCLAGALGNDETAGNSYELCGEELDYEQILRQAAGVLGARVLFYRVPYANQSFYAYTASLLTPVPDEIARAVIGALKFEIECRDRKLRELVPLEPPSLQEMLDQALGAEQAGEVDTSWSDAWPHEFEYSVTLEHVRDKVDYQAEYSITTAAAAEDLFAVISDVGGERGWLHDSWMWRLRGTFDRVLKGVGSERGRKRYGRLEVNEVIDFWRVEAIDPGRRLLLRAEMKLPGSGWLEFSIDDDRRGSRRVRARAYFIARGVAGRVYWYAFFPFHTIIFRRLLGGIARRSIAAAGNSKL